MTDFRLHIAAQKGDTETLHKIVNKRNVDTVYYYDSPGLTKTPYIGLTPLLVAVAAGKAAAVKILVSFDADVNFLDPHNRKAVHYAASNGDIEIFNILTEHDADNDMLRCSDSYGRNPVHYAVNAGHVAFVRMVAEVQPTIFELCDTVIGDLVPGRVKLLPWPQFPQN